MPEERGLYKRMKVRELLHFYGDLKGGTDLAPAVDEWLERLELSDWANRKIEELSKGMSQKVQFISTVVAAPDLIILDEPFTGLDPVNTDVIREAILEMRRQGATIIFSTHDMETAERMSDFIFMIFRGQKVLDGSLESIQERYGHDTVRLRLDNGHGALEGLRGIEKVIDYGREQELKLSRETDPQALLEQIVSRARVELFEIMSPSLHDIFVRIAGPEAEEVDDE